MKFPKQFLIDLLEDDKHTVANDYAGQRRWSTDWRLVFRHNGKFYETRYSTGSTEQQDERPFEYEADEVECPEVRPVEKTVTVYERMV